MPLLRYFLVVGGTLLALLLILSASLPAVTRDQSTPTAKADLSIIRIHSDKKWPERVVFDTTLPTIAPTTSGASVMAAAPAPQKSAAAEPEKQQVREAFAQLRPGSNESRNSEPRRKHRTVARYHFNQPLYMGSRPIIVAQQPRFGFFGSNIW